MPRLILHHDVIPTKMNSHYKKKVGICFYTDNELDKQEKKRALTKKCLRNPRKQIPVWTLLFFGRQHSLVVSN